MDESLFILLRRQLEDQKQMLLQTLADGGLPDFASYKLLSGKLLGLSTAQYLVDEFIDRIKRREDEDD